MHAKFIQRNCKEGVEGWNRKRKGNEDKNKREKTLFVSKRRGRTKGGGLGGGLGIEKHKTYTDEATLGSRSAEGGLVIDNRSQVSRRSDGPELRNRPLGRIGDGETVGDTVARRLGIVGEAGFEALRRG